MNSPAGDRPDFAGIHANLAAALRRKCPIVTPDKLIPLLQASSKVRPEDHHIVFEASMGMLLRYRPSESADRRSRLDRILDAMHKHYSGLGEFPVDALLEAARGNLNLYDSACYRHRAHALALIYAGTEDALSQKNPIESAALFLHSIPEQMYRYAGLSKQMYAYILRVPLRKTRMQPTSNNVTLSSQQDAALRAVSAWFRDTRGPQVFRLFGAAGTGKTTIAQHLIAIARCPAVCAYTGRAAMILRVNGIENATTIHSLIYTPHRDEINGVITYVKRQELGTDENGEIDLIVVDECSFVDEPLGRDLESFGIKILVLGDPNQLPPVKGQGYFVNPEIKPDFLLTEIRRQALDNPIIRLSQDVLLGKKLRPGSYGDSRVITRSEYRTRCDELVQAHLGANKVLVGTNRTRTGINNLARSLLGYEDDFPQAGEVLMCLKNNADLGFYNGSIWSIMEPRGCSVRVATYKSKRTMDTLISRWDERDGRGDPGAEVRVRCYSAIIESVDFPDSVPQDMHVPTEFFVGNPDKLHWKERAFDEFTFGYGSTVHKAQGGQYPKVLVIDESHVFGEYAMNHQYTAITRAQDALTFVTSD